MRQLLDSFFDAYLLKRDLELTLAVVSDQVISVGTGDQEAARNKEEFRSLLEREFRAVHGSFSYEIRDYAETRYEEDLEGAFCRMVTVLTADAGEKTVLETRLTAMARKEEDGWKFISFHMSEPAQGQEAGEFFPLRYGKQSAGRPIGQQAERKLIQMMSAVIPGGIMGGYLEKGFPLYVINDTMLRYLGYTYEELVRETNEEMVRVIAPEDRERVEREIFDSVGRTGMYEVQYQIVRRDGTRVWMLDRGNEVVTEDGRRAIISLMIDISESMDIQEKLKREAQEDELTRILNRKGAIHFIEKALKSQADGTLLLMDIDNFKRVNDNYGHMAGDRVLVELAQILQKSTRKGDVVARLGGDEFLVYINGCSILEIVSRRVETIGKLFGQAVESYPLAEMSVSTGIAVKEDGSTFEQLYREADAALYQVKNQKKGGYAFWKDEQETAVSRRPE
ncbi:MAG TPA: diguanylate cyclase [Candidatus Lachnoclostridium pullistercoris]|uniref:Diguanylate cyclase n=1 Tax=Candidatus Lachnoclostridium pullistercoris TaxID=2838632 RepID=A0A9D2PCW0_9FIRM|nr:diguanylate cyclase [Candidatus Lachnoclostridium pullistercoris]